MTTNREWLYSLDVADLADWFDAEHAEQHEGDELEAFAKRLELAAHDKLGVTLFDVDYVTEEFMLHVRDTLTAERDDWKAKAEGLTEALEKLGCSVLANGTVFESAPHVDAHSKAQSKTGQNLSERSESLSDEADSREKLEADIHRAADEMEEFTHGEKFINTNKILRWLNRQAAITEREVGGTLLRQDEQIAELTAERDALADDLLTCNKEREEYRELFSKSLTLAAEIVNLQP